MSSPGPTERISAGRALHPHCESGVPVDRDLPVRCSQPPSGGRSIDHADDDAGDDLALVEDVKQLRRLVLGDFRDASNPRTLAVGKVDEPDQTPALRWGPSGDDVAMRAGARPAELVVETIEDDVRHAVGELRRFQVSRGP